MSPRSTISHPVDPITGNNRASALVNGVIADIQVGKAVDNLLPQVGQNVTFTVTVTNLGPTAASNIQLLDHLPLGLSYVPSTVSQGTYDANTGEWSVGGLVLNGVATLTVTGLVGTTAAPSVTNHATKLSSSPFDSVTTNDSAAVIINIEEVADLQVRKTVDNETPAVGASIVYAVSVRNAGPSDATRRGLGYILPAGVSSVLIHGVAGRLRRGHQRVDGRRPRQRRHRHVDRDRYRRWSRRRDEPGERGAVESTRSQLGQRLGRRFDQRPAGRHPRRQRRVPDAPGARCPGAVPRCGDQIVARARPPTSS